MGDSLSFSSILSRYKPTASPAAPTDSTPTSSTQPSRASSASTNGVKPAQKLVSRPPTTTPLQTGSASPRTSAPAAFSASAARPPNPVTLNTSTQDVKPRPRDPEAQAAKRRKLEQPVKPTVMTSQEKEMEERKQKLLAIKQKKEAAAAAAARPKVASYKELLAEAQKYHEEKPISQIGVIKHKALAPIPVEKKPRAGIKGGKDAPTARDRKSKSPATAAASDKNVKKVGDSGKAVPLRKTGDAARPTSTKPTDRTIDRKRSADLSSAKRKRDDAAADVRKKSYSSAPRRSKYDDEEEDDWIVDDDDDPRGSGGGYGGYGGGSRYRYAEYSDEDDSDMEAAGIDILEEEDRSRIAAIREDQREAKRLEEEAKRKAALKKAAAGRLKK